VSVPEIKALIEAALRSSPRWYQLRRRKELRTKQPSTSP
jgi:hypothetical protein